MEWTGECGTPEAFIATRNLLRRHLTASQRAMIAAELANLANGGVRMNAQPVNGEEKTENPGLKRRPPRRRRAAHARIVNFKAQGEPAAKLCGSWPAFAALEG